MLSDQLGQHCLSWLFFPDHLFNVVFFLQPMCMICPRVPSWGLCLPLSTLVSYLKLPKTLHRRRFEKIKELNLSRFVELATPEVFPNSAVVSFLLGVFHLSKLSRNRENNSNFPHGGAQTVCYQHPVFSHSWHLLWWKGHTLH